MIRGTEGGVIPTLREAFVHYTMKAALRGMLRLIEIPDEFMQQDVEDQDPLVATLRRIRNEYPQHEGRVSRIDENIKVLKILELLVQDKYCRERFGWWLFEMHDAIVADQIHKEKLGRRGDKVGYAPEDWYGSPTGRGHKMVEIAGLDP